MGFSNFLYKHIVPACIMAPLSPAFDLKDGQTILVSSALYVTNPHLLEMS